MDFEEIKKQTDKAIDEMCEKNGYDKEYVKNSYNKSMENLKGEDGNLDMNKVNELLSNYDIANDTVNSFLSPEMIQQSMRMANILFGGTSSSLDDDKDEDEYNDIIIED